MPEFKAGDKVSCTDQILTMSLNVGLVEGDRGVVIRQAPSIAEQYYVRFDKPLNLRGIKESFKAGDLFVMAPYELALRNNHVIEDMFE